MKKVIIFIAMFIILATAVACSADYANKEQEEIRSKTYKVAVDYGRAPFAFLDGGSEQAGIDIDLFKAVAENQNFSFEFIEMPMENAYQAVENGEVDIVVSGIKITEEKKKSLDFSGPYIQSGVVMFANKHSTKVKSESSLDTPEKAKVKNKVAVRKNTDAAKYAYELTNKYDFEVVEFATVKDVLDSVMTDEYIAAFEEDIFVEYAILNDKPLQILTENVDLRSYAFAVKKDTNEEFLKILDTGLKNVMNNGEYEEILEKYELK